MTDNLQKLYEDMRTKELKHLEKKNPTLIENLIERVRALEVIVESLRKSKV